MDFTMVIHPSDGAAGSWNHGVPLEQTLRHGGLKGVKPKAVFVWRIQQDSGPIPRNDVFDLLCAGVPQTVRLALRVQHIRDFEQGVVPTMDRSH